MKRWIAPLSLMVLGFALRAWAVGGPALRGDEAFSVTVIARSASELIAMMGRSEPNPPLYLFLLKGWTQWAGPSELAARWPSVLAGALTVALTYRLGRAWANESAARWAAALTALNPFLIWYAQDARAYSLWVMLTLAATWQMWNAARRGGAGRWLMAGGLWWLALFTHYFAALSFFVTGLALLIAPGTRARWKPALLTALGVGAAYAPWAIYVAPLLLGHTKSWIADAPLWDLLARTLNTFAVGTTAPREQPALGNIAALIFGALILFGWIAAFRRDKTRASWLTATGAGVVLMLMALSLLRPMFTTQYAIVSVPGLLLLAATACAESVALRESFINARQPRPRGWERPRGRGLRAFAESVTLSRTAAKGLPAGRKMFRALALLGLMGLALPSLRNYYFDPAYAKSPDWRGVTEYLARTARPEEVVALNLPDPAFYHYYRAAMPVEATPSDSMAAVGEAGAEAQLTQLRDSYQHIRFFYTPSPLYDPDGFVGRWLAECCEQLSDEFVAGFRVQTFDTPRGSLAARQPLEIQFENGLALTGYRVLDDSLRAGEPFHLTLYWTTSAPISTSYTVFVHLLVADGFNVQSADSLPASGRRPTDGWRASETVIDPHPLVLDINLPPGAYALEIGLYDASTQQRLRAGNADAVRLPVALQVETP